MQQSDPTPTPDKHTGRYVTRKGDTFTRHCKIDGTTQTDLVRLIGVALDRVEDYDRTAAALSFLAAMLKRSTKAYCEPLDEYLQGGLAAVLDSLNTAHSYYTEEWFSEIETLQMYHRQEKERQS